MRRGLVGESRKGFKMAKFIDKRYPEYNTYKGKAVEGKLICVTLPFVDITDKIVDTIETEVANDGATLLTLKIYSWIGYHPEIPGKYARWWHIILQAYGGTITYGSMTLPLPAWVGWVAIIAALAVSGVIIYFITKEIKEIFYVFVEEPLAMIPFVVGISGLAFVSYLAYKTIKGRGIAIPA